MDINNHNWDENIPSPLNAIDAAKFQDELDRIAGVEPDGTKRWRLVWGQDLQASAEWDRYGRRWVPRYRWKAIQTPVANPATGIIEQRTEWIGIPRYFVEALIPRVHRNEEAERAGTDPDGQDYTERRIAGADYVTMFCVCQHDGRKNDDGWRPCCLDQIRDGKACFGRYRVPDQVDIDTLAEDFYLRAQSKLCRPDERPSEKDKAFLYSAWMVEQMREEQKINEELEYRRKNILSTVLPWRHYGHLGAKKNRYAIPGL